MMLRKILLGTTAVVGAGMAAVASPTSARCSRGHARWLSRHRRSPASRGSRRSAASRTIVRSTPTLSRGLDFRNDTEVHVIARGKSEETGLEYGATIEFEADTNTRPQHRRDLDLPARRLGRAPAGRRGRRGRQQRGRRPDHGGRHGRYRRLGRGDRRGTAGVPDQQQRRDQGPLLHAELRRLQPRRQLHADPGELSTAAPTTASSSPTRTAPWRWTARTSSRVPSSTTAISAGWA